MNYTAPYLPGLAPSTLPPAAALNAAPETWLRTFLESCVASIVPRDYMAPDEWSAKNIIFSHESDPVKGPIDFSLSPFLRDPRLGPRRLDRNARGHRSRTGADREVAHLALRTSLGDRISPRHIAYILHVGPEVSHGEHHEAPSAHQ